VTETILIAEDELEVARLVSAHLEAHGFVCHEAQRGDDALDLALTLRPDLVVLNQALAGIEGIEVCRRLRNDPRTAATGIIMVSTRTTVADRVTGLEAGADDYLDKPFEVQELVARVHTSLRRARQLRSTSPLTGLPGNFEIEHRLEALVADEVPFALMHADLDSFKSYNDHYGFLRGDRAIVLTARVLQRALAAHAGHDGFLGHVGGDDFAVVCPPEVAELVASEIVRTFDEHAPMLYEPEDRERGWVEVVDRAGASHRRPLLSVSLGIATTAARPFASATEAAAAAVEMKRFAKSVPGSVYKFDRRRG
jgi:diguanylate cyclase (GGDEF)-like protein